MSKFDCTILNPIEKPTFYRHIFNELVSTSTLDLVVVNENLTTKLSDFEVIEVSGVVGAETKQSYYHLPVSCTFSFEHKINRQKPSFHSSYLYEKADWSKLINEIEKNLINSQNESVDVDIMNDKLLSAIKFAADKFIPKTREPKNREFNFPPNVVQLLDNRNFWAHAFRSSRSALFAKKYKQAQLSANEAIAQYKRDNW